jgi:hypothetical protein
MRVSLLSALAYLILLVVIMSPASQAAADKAKPFLDIKMTAERYTYNSQGQLTLDAQELADLLKIKPLVMALWQAKQTGISSADLPKKLQYARLLCLWKIFTASEEERKVVGEINNDLATSYIALDGLEAKRNMTNNMLNTANFMQSGILGTVKQSMGLRAGTNIPRQDLAIISGGIGVTLASSTLLVPYIWNHEIDSPPNILARIFNREHIQTSNNGKSYLWKYFNSPIPGSSITLTRREILIKHWEEFAHINSKDEKNICRLASLPYLSRSLNESIFYINRRITLMHDLNTHVEEFDIALCQLHNAISFD